MRGLDLELFRSMFESDKIHIAVALIKKIEVAPDRSIMRCKVAIFPEEREAVATMTWDHVGADCGIFAFPAVNDLVIVAVADGGECFVIKRLTSREDKIPVQAMDGSTVVKALAGKKAHLLSDTEIQLSRTGAGTQPLVLGNIAKALLSQVLELISAHKHIGNLGYLTAVPDNTADFLAKKATPVDDGAILSDIAKTEK